MRLVKGAPNLMQRLSRLPAAPNVTLLDRRKPKPHPWPHDNTTFIELIYIRWCCIDLSNAPAELEKRIEGHDEEIMSLFEAIRQLMEPPEEPSKRIGFHA